MRWGCQEGHPLLWDGDFNRFSLRGLPFTHPFVDPVITATFPARVQLLSAVLLLILAERTEEQ